MNQTAQSAPQVKEGETASSSRLPIGVIVVALLTFVNSIPGFSVVRILSELHGWQLALNVVLGLLVRGVLGVVGGIQLLRMKKSGLILVSIVWAAAVFTILMNVSRLFFVGFPEGFTQANALFLNFRSLVVGLLFLVYLWWPTIRRRFERG